MWPCTNDSETVLTSGFKRETYPQRWDRFESTLHYCGPWSLHFGGAGGCHGLLRRHCPEFSGRSLPRIVQNTGQIFHIDQRSKAHTVRRHDDERLIITWEAGGATIAKPNGIYERIPNRWEVGLAVAVLDGQFQHVSFANSISTTKGRAPTCCGQNLEEHSPTFGRAIIFINALIENPSFDSQTKDTLSLQASKFGTKPLLSEDLMKKVSKSPIFKADQQIKKTDGTKRSRLTGLPKLADANNAGTKHASKCTPILTEGDSQISGHLFPLRGKLLNVREARHDQIMKNEEMQNIKKIMGLQHAKDYTSTASLRFGDHDGSHIKGLIINFLDHFYPSLLKLDDFLVEFVTPIVRVTKGARQRKDFFTIPEYEQWAEETPDSVKGDVKYYKGLGTSKDSDARDYFSHMEKHMIPFARTQDGDRELIELAFSKKKADERKEWLRQFKVCPGTYLDHRLEEIPYSEFINKELILFSMADNIRSIPCVADGLKPGQRKVMWDCFKRIMKKEVKFGPDDHQLAQTYVGSNNINLLEPNGQYGARDQGGKDHASARYIHTLLTRISRAIYHPHDDPLLNQQKDDNGR
ncbi:topoisomerase II [Mycena polygramma]|nr:topoisomerase II [Mycena polygramma]